MVSLPMQQDLTHPTPTKEIISTITSKGQITLPVEVRRHLGLKRADKVAFVIDQQGVVEVKPAAYPTIATLRGAAGSLHTPLSWQEVKKIAHEDRLEVKNHNGK